MSTLREMIIKCNDRFTTWIVTRPLRREKDSQRRFEIKLWLEISGAFLGGQAADGAWANYKKYYYDKIPTEDEKKRVRSTLLSMIKSDNYDVSKKAIIAHVCADLEIKEALSDVNDLLQRAQNRTDLNELHLAFEALSRGITAYDLVSEKFRRGERM